MKGLVFGGAVLAAVYALVPAQAHDAPPPSKPIDDAAGAAAAAAAAIDDDRAAPATHGHQMHRHDDGRALAYDHRDADVGDVTYRGRWTGSWTGHYEGQPATVYNGTYEGSYDDDGESRQHGARHHHSRHHSGPMAYPGHTVYQSGYGYAWGAPVMTTITFQSMPVVTTTTTTTEEIVYGAAARVKRPARRVWKPRPKQRCTC